MNSPGSDFRLSGYLESLIVPRGFPVLPEGWDSDWETFPSADGGIQLFAVTHRDRGADVSDDRTRRALLVIHGMGEHGGRYIHFPHFLRQVVSSVHCLDLRGHGRSEGLRGHVESFNQLTDDIALAIRRFHEQGVKRHGEGFELHVLGHSLGGHLVLRTAFLHSDLPASSLSISAPFLGIKVDIPVVKEFMARVISGIWGSLQLSTELDAGLLSHDPEVVAAYREDRLVHDKMTPRFYTEVRAAMADTLERTEGLKRPVLFQVAPDDAVVDGALTIDLFDRLKHRAKELKTYPGLKHEIFNELGKEKVFADLEAWILRQSRVAGSAARAAAGTSKGE